MKGRSRMSLALTILGGLIGLVALAGGILFLIGTRLPVAHVATCRVQLNAPPDRVFAHISDFAHQGDWWSAVTKMERLPDREGKPVWRQITQQGPLDAELTLLEPPTRMVTTIVGNKDFGGTWTYLLEPAPGGCTLTVTENGEVYTPLFRAMSKYLFGHYSTLEGYLNALTTKLGGSAPERVD